MSRHHMDDGTVVDTDNAFETWKEDTRWDGNNYISVATGSQWDHQQLYKSRTGRYYLVHTSQWQGRTPYAECISHQRAAAWLLANNHEIPPSLKDAAAAVFE